MPKAPTVCPVPGCPNPQPCDQHKPKPWAGSKRRQVIGTSGSAQQRTARAVLTRDRHTCYQCGQRATIADHVIPLAEGGTHNMANMGAICAGCHKDKTLAEAARARRSANAQR